MWFHRWRRRNTPNFTATHKHWWWRRTRQSWEGRGRNRIGHSRFKSISKRGAIAMRRIQRRRRRSLLLLSQSITSPFPFSCFFSFILPARFITRESKTSFQLRKQSEKQIIQNRISLHHKSQKNKSRGMEKEQTDDWGSLQADTKCFTISSFWKKSNTLKMPASESASPNMLTITPKAGIQNKERNAKS